MSIICKYKQFFKKTLLILINLPIIFYSFLQAYNTYSIQPEATSTEIIDNNDEENTVIAKLFKKRNIDQRSELELYLSLPTLGG
jgi:hypothetical protein